MKLTLKEYRRLQYKARALDRVCRILWPDSGRPTGRSARALDEIEVAIGDYRPDNSAQAATYAMRIEMKD